MAKSISRRRYPGWVRWEISWQYFHLRLAVVGLTAFLASASVYVLLMSFDWAFYVAGSVGYTVLVFGFARVDYDSKVFFKHDVRPIRAALPVHLAIVALLIVFVRAAVYFRPEFPLRMFAEGRKGTSWYWIFVIGVGGIVMLIEQKWLSTKGRRGK